MSEERKEFEIWYGDKYSNYALTTWDGERYNEFATQLAWRSWQAAEKRVEKYTVAAYRYTTPWGEFYTDNKREVFSDPAVEEWETLYRLCEREETIKCGDIATRLSEEIEYLKKGYTEANEEINKLNARLAAVDKQ